MTELHADRICKFMNERQKQVHEQVKQNLIVSCQALADEPLHSPTIMGRMAIAAKEGGAKAIRANSLEDIQEIKQASRPSDYWPEDRKSTRLNSSHVASS